MKIGKEKEIKYVTMDVELTQREFDILYKLGLKEIKKDKAEVINYAINKLLREKMKGSNKKNNAKKRL